MISAFERSSLVFLAGVVGLAIGGALILGSRETPEPSPTAGAPAQGQPAKKDPLPLPIPKPADVALSYDLEAVAAGAPVPRSIVSALPGNVLARDTGEEIIRAMLPLVLLANEEVLAERRQLWSIRFRQKRGDPVPPEQQLWLRVVAERY